MAVKILTLGFVSAGTFESTMKHLYEGNFLEKPRDHYFLYQHYPLKKEETKQRQLRVCEKYNIHWYDAGYDRGLHKGMNYLFELVNPDDDDVIIGFDPDEWPISPGFDQAFEDALNDPVHPNFGFASMLNNYLQATNCILIGGRRVEICPIGIIPMTISAFKAGWFRQIGGWQQPTNYYGHLEHHIVAKIRETGKLCGILGDFMGINKPNDLRLKTPLVDYVHEDSIYRQYKDTQAKFIFTGSFEEFLRARGVDLE